MVIEDLESLDKKMFEFANEDFKTAELLINKKYFCTSIYFLEQSFEKNYKIILYFYSKTKRN